MMEPIRWTELRLFLISPTKNTKRNYFVSDQGETSLQGISMQSALLKRTV